MQFTNFLSASLSLLLRLCADSFCEKNLIGADEVIEISRLGRFMYSEPPQLLKITFLIAIESSEIALVSRRI